MKSENLEKEIKDYEASNGKNLFKPREPIYPGRRLLPGEIVFELSEPKNKEEAFDRFYQYHSKLWLKQKLSWVKADTSLETTLSDIKNQITKWENDSDLNLLVSDGTKDCKYNDKGLTYLRLKSGHFEKLEFSENLYIGLQLAAHTFATYFYFKDWLEKEIEKQKHVTSYQNDCNPKQAELPPLLAFDEELAEIKKLENKLWKGLPMEDVINHFKIMTVRNSKNGKPFLTDEQFISFLKKGFLKDASQTRQIINYSPREKGFVIKRFYEFYDLAVCKYKHPQRKIKFITLMTDCFDNWEQKSIDPFFKPNKTKETW